MKRIDPKLLRLATAMALIVAGLVWTTGCESPTASGPMPVTLSLPEQATGEPGGVLARVPTRAVSVELKSDWFTGNNQIGERQAAFGKDMGVVYLNRDPLDIVRQVFESELKAAGHSVVERDPAVVIKGRVREFKIGTRTTPLYWDVVATLDVSFTVSVMQSQKVSGEFHYTSEHKQRTFVWPTDDIMARLLAQCLDDLRQKLRTDTDLATAMSH